MLRFYDYGLNVISSTKNGCIIIKKGPILVDDAVSLFHSTINGPLRSMAFRWVVCHGDCILITISTIIYIYLLKTALLVQLGIVWTTPGNC